MAEETATTMTTASCESVGGSDRRKRAYYYSLATSCPTRDGGSGSARKAVANGPTEKPFASSLLASSSSSSSRRRHLRSSGNINDDGYDDLAPPRRRRRHVTTSRAPTLAIATDGIDEEDEEDVEIPRWSGKRSHAPGRRCDDDDMFLPAVDLDALGAKARNDDHDEEARLRHMSLGETTPFDGDIRDDLLGSLGQGEDGAVEDEYGYEEEETREAEVDGFDVPRLVDQRFCLSEAGETDDLLLDVSSEIDDGEEEKVTGDALGDDDDDDDDDDDQISLDSLMYSLSGSRGVGRRDDDLHNDDDYSQAAGPRVLRIDDAINISTDEIPRWAAYDMPVRVKDLVPLWSRLTERLAVATCKYERTFYADVKDYLSRQSKCVMPSDVGMIEEFTDDFESTLTRLNDEGNDYDAICNYGGWVERIIDEANEYMSSSPANVLPNDSNPAVAATKDLRHMWDKVIRKKAAAECQYERKFYAHLKWYMSRRSRQSRGQVSHSELVRINECTDEFEAALRRMNDKRNDYNDIRFYGSLIEEIITDGYEKLSIIY